jgi:hypothetical protein
VIYFHPLESIVYSVGSVIEMIERDGDVAFVAR